MLNYLPEKLYNAIEYSKYKNEYDEIVEKINMFRTSCNTLTDSLRIENAEYVKSDKNLMEAKQRLDSLVHDHFPEYALSYDIQQGMYSRDELIDIYKSLKNKTKVGLIDDKAICLDEIVDNSYGDNTYLKYMKDYTKEYADTPVDNKMKLSTFAHMKNMRASIFIKIEETRKNEPKNWLSVCDGMIDIYNKTITFTGDNDSITHQFVECMCDFLVAMSGSKHIDNYIEYMYNLCFNRLHFQYDEYSYGKANMLMIISRISADKGDYTTFINSTQELCRYNNRALLNIPELINGLTFFDKTNTTMFISILRWILMLNKKIKVIRDNKICIIKNLNINDYETAFADMAEINKTLPYHKTDVCADKFSESIDSWFSENNGAYRVLAAM